MGNRDIFAPNLRKLLILLCSLFLAICPLTTGIDSMTGGDGNDTFVAGISATAANNTFGAVDTLGGGSGTDVLNITADAYASGDVAPAAIVSAIETINVRAVDATAADVLLLGATSFSGATAFNANLATSAITFGTAANTNALAAGQSVGMIGNGIILNGALTAHYGNTVTAGTFNISGGTGTASANANAVLTQTGTGITSNTINSTGGANFLNNVVVSGAANVALTVNAATNLTTGNITGFTGTTSAITVSGAAALVNLGTIEATTVKTITASGMTAGGVTATLNNNTTFVFAGGAGQDIITAGAVLAAGASVDAAGGATDRLVITADAQLTTVTAPFYKGFEVLQANTGVTADASQLSANNTITGIRINDSASAIVAVNGLTAAQAANVAIIAAADATGAITLGLTGATTGGQIDTVNATLTTTTTAGAAQVSNLTGIVLTGVEKLVLTGNNTVPANTGALTLTTTAALSLDSITVTNAGANTITIAAGQTATNLVVDAALSLGATTIDASLYATATGATLKGGLGHDIIEGTALGDSITGGTGNDVLSGTATAGQTAGTDTAVGTIATSVAAATAADTFTGGAGMDVFGIGVGAIATMSTITDLNLGTAVVGGAVDRIVTDSTASAVTVVAFTTAQQATITAAASFSAALDAAINAFGAVAAVASTFTYGTDTYFVLNDVAATTTFTATDLVVKITGVTGTLDASDITLL